MISFTRAIALSLLALTCCLSVPEVMAATDFKSINAVVCLPYGPNTLLTELSYTQKGVTNPGTTNESVLCSIASDSETAWSSTAGTSASWVAYYQAGSIPGRVACGAR